MATTLAGLLPGDPVGRYHTYRWQQSERRYREHMTWSMSHPEHFAGDLPAGYGKDLTERAVEFGWAAAQSVRGCHGRRLDAEPSVHTGPFCAPGEVADNRDARP
jgi:hypothetical protein